MGTLLLIDSVTLLPLHFSTLLLIDGVALLLVHGVALLLVDRPAALAAAATAPGPIVVGWGASGLLPLAIVPLRRPPDQLAEGLAAGQRAREGLRGQAGNQDDHDGGPHVVEICSVSTLEKELEPAAPTVSFFPRRGRSCVLPPE